MSFDEFEHEVTNSAVRAAQAVAALKAVRATSLHSDLLVISSLAPDIWRTFRVVQANSRSRSRRMVVSAQQASHRCGDCDYRHMSAICTSRADECAIGAARSSPLGWHIDDDRRVLLDRVTVQDGRRDHLCRQTALSSRVAGGQDWTIHREI
ncbi:hypothetical protein ACWDTP_02120 [Mycobacterium sp. NPDC003449]